MKRADIYRGTGRNTAEVANQGMQTANAAMPSGALPTQGAPTQGSAAAVLVCIIIIFFVLRLFSGKTGDAERYGGITPSFFNIMVITMAGLIGGTVLKALAVNLPPNNAMRQLIVANA